MLMKEKLKLSTEVAKHSTKSKYDSATKLIMSTFQLPQLVHGLVESGTWSGIILYVLGECTWRQVLSAPWGNYSNSPSKSSTNCFPTVNGYGGIANV